MKAGLLKEATAMAFSFFEFGGDWKQKATALEKKTADLEKARKDLTEQLAGARAEARRLKDENENEQAEAKRIVTMAKSTILDLKAELRTSKQAFGNAQQSLAEASALKSKVLNVQKQLRFSKGLEEKLKATVKEKDAKAAELGHLREKVAKLGNLVSSHAGLHDALVEDLSSAKSMLNQARDENVELRDSMRKLKTEVVNATQDHQSFLDQISSLKRENETLRKGFWFDKRKTKWSPKRKLSPTARTDVNKVERPSFPTSPGRIVGVTSAGSEPQTQQIKALEYVGYASKIYVSSWRLTYH